jgi:hypothetical protein
VVALANGGFVIAYEAGSAEDFDMLVQIFDANGATIGSAFAVILRTRVRRTTRSSRPSTGIGPNVGLRLHADLAAKLDDWIAYQVSPPSRPKAIRRLLAKALDA